MRLDYYPIDLSKLKLGKFDIGLDPNATEEWAPSAAPEPFDSLELLAMTYHVLLRRQSVSASRRGRTHLIRDTNIFRCSDFPRAHKIMDRKVACGGPDRIT